MQRHVYKDKIFHVHVKRSSLSLNITLLKVRFFVVTRLELAMWRLAAISAKWRHKLASIYYKRFGHSALPMHILI